MGNVLEQQRVGDGDLEHNLSLRVTAADEARLTSIVSRLPGLSGSARSQVLRAAVRIGLEALDKNPALVLTTTPPEAGGPKGQPSPRPRRKRGT